MRAPLRRTWPEPTSAVAALRVFTTRACHSHLSIRWRCWASPPVWLLLVTFELRLERRQLGERRIRIRLLAAAALVRRRPGARRTVVVALVAVAARTARRTRTATF